MHSLGLKSVNLGTPPTSIADDGWIRILPLWSGTGWMSGMGGMLSVGVNLLQTLPMVAGLREDWRQSYQLKLFWVSGWIFYSAQYTTQLGIVEGAVVETLVATLMNQVAGIILSSTSVSFCSTKPCLQSTSTDSSSFRFRLSSSIGCVSCRRSCHR